jgi:hypothetical protein
MMQDSKAAQNSYEHANSSPKILARAPKKAHQPWPSLTLDKNSISFLLWTDFRQGYQDH